MRHTLLTKSATILVGKLLYARMNWKEMFINFATSVIKSIENPLYLPLPYAPSIPDSIRYGFPNLKM